jgi:hypothetical protein
VRSWLKSKWNAFVGLPRWEPVRTRWSRVHSWLSSKLDDQVGFAGWLWRLAHQRDWQKSSFVTGLSWIVCTFAVVKLVGRLGYRWEMNVGVSLAVEGVMYFVHREWVFKRPVDTATSGRRNVTVWTITFGINVGLAWVVMSWADFSTFPARVMLGGYGLLMNPVMFLLRDKLIFDQLTVRKIAAANRQFLQLRALKARKVAANGWQFLRQQIATT